MTKIFTLDIRKTILLCLILTLLGLSNCYAETNDKVKSTQSLKLSACKDDKQFLCGNIAVPLDYRNPQLGKIDLPMRIHPATQKSQGYLLFNFGGPWANNVKILPSITKKRLTTAMIENFDLLVVNPRGVNPNVIQCHTENPAVLNETDEAISKILSNGNEHDAERLYLLTKQKQTLCQYDKLYKYASTANSVQDIETLRKALHTDKLNFYMDSYGTKIGLAYLVKYPQHVQRIILDGNIAPSNQLMSLIGPRAYGAVTTVNAFFQYCSEAGTNCILNSLLTTTQIKNSASLINRFNQLLIYADKNQGIPTSSQYANRPLTSGMIRNLMYTEMDPSNWQNLSQALYQAEKNNSGNALMTLYINNTDYDPKNNSYGTDNNATRSAVICEDYVTPNFNRKATWLKFINQINSKYSQIGTIATLWLTPICINWNVKSTALLHRPPKIPPSNTSTSPQVLIIGNLKDPMTPFSNALAVKAYLKKFNIQATILEWNGLSHTALITDSPLSACVFRNVNKFLLDKSLPKFIKCNDWENPFLRID